MASQTVESLYFSLSSAGSPIRIDGSSAASPQQIHDAGSMSTPHLDAVFMRIHNPTASAVDVTVLFLPQGNDSTSLDKASLVYTVPAHDDVWVFRGQRMGETASSWETADSGHVGLEAYVDAGDINKLLVLGWVDRVFQPGA